MSTPSLYVEVWQSYSHGTRCSPLYIFLVVKDRAWDEDKDQALDEDKDQALDEDEDQVQDEDKDQALDEDEDQVQDEDKDQPASSRLCDD